MTREHAQALLPIITAYAEGKKIQHDDNAGSGHPPVWRDIPDPQFRGDPANLRIKPTPKLVPMTSDDLPPVVWVRMGDNPMELVIGVTGSGNLITRACLASTQKFHEEGYTWSPDRKTWHSFMKEVEG